MMRKLVTTGRLIAALATLTLTLTLAVSPGTARAEGGAPDSGPIKIAATVSTVSNIFSKIQAPFEKETGRKLVLVSNGTSPDAFQKVADDQADAGASANTWDDLMKALDEGGHPLQGREHYHNTIIGRDRLRVLVNGKAQVKKLTQAQIKSIFTGQATRWSEVGGADLPIVVILAATQPTAGKFFSEKLMDKAPFRTEGVKTYPDAEKMIQAIGTTAGGVGFGPLGLTDPKVEVPEAPEAARPLILFTKGRPNPKVRELLTFIREKGAQSGIVR